MKVVEAKLGGTPTPGDTIMLHYSGSRGGRSTASYIVRPGDTLTDVGHGIIGATGNSNYLGEFVLKLKNDTIMIICSNLVHDVTFFSEILGAGTETLTVEEL